MGVLLVVQDLLNLGMDEATAADTWPVKLWEGSQMGNVNALKERFVLSPLSNADEVFAEK